MDLASASPSTTTPASQPYASAIIFSFFSLLIALLILPPMLWHLTNRNIGATSLILWLLILNLQDFLNAIIWSHDNRAIWFRGEGLCDVEVKIMVAAYVGASASVACMLRALAKVMDTDNTRLGMSKGERRLSYAVDLLWCWGFPALQMLFHYIVQTKRYYVVGIVGCLPAVSNSWVTEVLIIAPPVVWALVGGYYSALVLIRLHRYRRNFTTLLANSNTNGSRFIRLFAICLVWLLISIPVQAFVISQQTSTEHVPFSWSAIHDPVAWQDIEMIPSEGNIIYTRYVWVGAGFLVFIFFGFGRDAGRMYVKGLRAVGLGKCLPASSGEPVRRNASHAGTISSVGSKARLLFGRKSHAQSFRSWGTESRSSKGTAFSETNEPLSPRTLRHLETVQENAQGAKPEGHGLAPRLPVWLGGRPKVAASDPEKGLSTKDNGESSFYRLTSPFRSPAAVHGAETEPVSMNNIMRRQDVTVHAIVAAGRSESMDSVNSRCTNQKGVLVRKEVKQGSEVAGNGS